MQPKSHGIFLASLVTVLACTATPAAAQITYVNGINTVANGNPLTGTYPNGLRIGLDNSGNPVAGARADIVAPAVNVGDIGAASDARVNIIGGQYLHFVNGYPFSGVFLQNTALLTLSGNVTLGNVSVYDSANFVMQQGRVESVQLLGASTATINGGLVASQNSFSVMDANTAGSVLTINGGTTTGAVRAALGGMANLTDGEYGMLHALPAGHIVASGGLTTSARLVSLNRSNGVGTFGLVGTGFTLSNPYAGIYHDPTYLISGPGVHFTLTGALADGTVLNGSYFEEGLSLGQAAQHISFATAVPEPGTWWMWLAAMPLLAGAMRRHRG